MQFNVAIDAKGRMNFPSRLREKLGEVFHITKTLGAKCIKVYSADGWKSLVERIQAAPSTETAPLQRFLFGSKQDIEPDKQGRFVMSAALREYAEIETETEVVIVELEGSAEIWSTANWSRYMSDENMEKMLDIASKFNI
ncbi:MAG: division/cell wall cluster transcriptional repressor MraZ [Oscillospiraceae bacterium]|nr:division/cell wall cluster transcriptional repressor MraZ [Oscillospiraceae bacterium]